MTDFNDKLVSLAEVFSAMGLTPEEIGLNLSSDNGNNSIDMIAIKRFAKADILRRNKAELQEENGILNNLLVDRSDITLRNSNNQTQTMITGPARRIFPYLNSFVEGALTKNIFTLLVPVLIPAANYRYLIEQLPSNYYSDEKITQLQEEVQSYQNGGFIQLELSSAIEGQDRLQFGTKSYVPETQKNIFLEYKCLHFRHDHLIILKLRDQFKYICLTITKEHANQFNLHEGFYEDLKTRSSTLVPFNHFIKTTDENIRINKLLSLLKKNPNLILYGPPGTGKTFYIDKLKNHFDKNKMVTFHQSYSYEEFVEGITLEIDQQNGNPKYEPKTGIFREMCIEAIKPENQDKSFVLFIDEINRGNVTKIFGELITLIEKDKRSVNMAVELPYSKEELYVPSNIFIVGTMNTTDRSISLMDAAFRRRFSFFEVMPDFNEFLKDNVDEKIKISINAIKKINEFITKEIDRNHQIGQGYFYDLLSSKQNTLEDDILYIWLYQIIPLLQEYFYSDSKEIADILGDIISFNVDQLSFDIKYDLDYKILEKQLKKIGNYIRFVHEENIEDEDSVQS